jgi:hypothetical protein
VRLTVLSEPDALGRSRYLLCWVDREGVDRPEIGKDGKRVGFRRGQVFFGVPPEKN